MDFLGFSFCISSSCYQFFMLLRDKPAILKLHPLTVDLINGLVQNYLNQNNVCHGYRFLSQHIARKLSCNKYHKDVAFPT